MRYTVTLGGELVWLMGGAPITYPTEEAAWNAIAEHCEQVERDFRRGLVVSGIENCDFRVRPLLTLVR